MMYVTYDDDGEIKSLITCQPEHRPEGNNVLETDTCSPQKQYVQNGVLTSYTEEQQTAKANRPSAWHVWSNASMAWNDTRSLDHIKMLKWDSLKQRRYELEIEPITVGNNTFDADADSQSKIAGAVQLAQLSLMAGQQYSIDWTLVDNSVATLTAQELIAVGVALGTRTSAIYATARNLRSQIEAATTTAEVEAIVWEQ